MCGIAGICRPTDRVRDDRDRLQAMSRALVHRGPDDDGIYISPERTSGLVHRRLSIVDLTSGHQPMSTADRRTHIVFNGEIYNHQENRGALEAQGVVFATQSDTESILYLYKKHGKHCVDFLRGMFAFAIWDENRKELFIARDRLGIKPLYYHLASDGSLVFASEIKAILEAGVLSPSINVEAMPDYLANRATSDNQTLFEGVFRLEPGHSLTWNEGRISIDRYWNIADINSGEAGALSVNDCSARWLEIFEESVRLRLMSDVPLGMFLSGGIDSSAIAAVMSRMVDDPIKTFSVAFNVPEANELAYARQVAGRFGTDHHEVIVEPDDFMSAIPHLVYQEDEPIAHSASVPLYFVSELARRYVKVVLTGEGSDELLGGYLKYPKTLMNLRLGRAYHGVTNEPVRRIVRRVLNGVSPASIGRKLRRTFFWLDPDIDSIYFDNFAVFNRDLQSSLIHKSFRDHISSANPYAGVETAYNLSSCTSTLRRILIADQKTYLHELLMKQDQMSMAASIESRVPFLDHELVEFSNSLPDRMKVRSGQTKRVLRHAMRGLLPDTILNRPKMGFPVPLSRWLRESHRWMLDEYLLSNRVVARKQFNNAYLQQIVAEHTNGTIDHTERLWMLINFEIWQRHILEGEPRTGGLPEVTEHLKSSET